MNDYRLSEALKAKLDAADTLDEVLAACREEGLDITREQLEAAEASRHMELGEEDLDQVAGGYVAIVLFVAVAVMLYWWYVQSRRR